jgi:coatomer protein complex subunit epsilon
VQAQTRRISKREILSSFPISYRFLISSLSVALISQIYLSINRVDLAKKEFERAKHWAEDDVLLQLIESSIGLVSGKDSYSNSTAFYTEQLGNPSLSSPHLLTARGVTRLLRNEIPEAKSDLDDSLSQQSGDAEALAALVVAAGLGATKKTEADELWRCVRVGDSSCYTDYPRNVL